MATGVRRILDNAADRSLATRHAEAWYVATVLATAATSWALLTIARALTAATKDGHRWSCLIAHGTERQGTWAPGIAPTIWSDLGPA